MKKAIILAAGRGSRLLPIGSVEHKALSSIGGQPLILHQIEMLRTAGITSVSVVVGHAADQIQSLLGNKVTYIRNPRYGETNSLYSLLLALNHWSGPFVLLNCDLLFHPSILDRLLEADGSALAFDAYSGTEPEEMKVSINGGRITAMAKDMPPNKVSGENIGLLKFDRRTVPLLHREAMNLIAAGHLNHWAPAAVSAVAQFAPIRAVAVDDLPWIEIDFPSDLKDARTEICPSIPGCAYGPIVEPYHQNDYKRARLVAGL